MFEEIVYWVSDLIFPVILLITGLLMSKYPVKKINSGVGYRTSRSMASQEAWDYANTRFPKIYLVTGIIFFALFTADKAAAFFIADDRNIIYYINSVIGIIGCLLPIPIIEKELKVLNTKSIEKGKK